MRAHTPRPNSCDLACSNPKNQLPVLHLGNAKLAFLQLAMQQRRSYCNYSDGHSRSAHPICSEIHYLWRAIVFQGRMFAPEYHCGSRRHNVLQEETKRSLYTYTFMASSGSGWVTVPAARRYWVSLISHLGNDYKEASPPAKFSKIKITFLQHNSNFADVSIARSEGFKPQSSKISSSLKSCVTQFFNKN